MGDEFIFSRDGAEPNDRLIEAVTDEIEHGELEIGFGGEGGTGSGGDTGVNLA